MVEVNYEGALKSNDRLVWKGFVGNVHFRIVFTHPETSNKPTVQVQSLDRRSGWSWPGVAGEAYILRLAYAELLARK